MNLTRDQFEALARLERLQGAPLPPGGTGGAGPPPSPVPPPVVRELAGEGLLAETGGGRLAVTPSGYRALEPYRVKRAVFMAAGLGSRMAPVTLTTPKPLVKVRGKRIIDTLLDAVLAAGITDIVIVRGHLAGQFDALLGKYPTIRFVENPLYNAANNISSGYVARGLYSNAYVLDADLLLCNPGLIRKYEYEANYLGVPVEKTDDWCFEAPGGIITRIKVGGEKVYHWIGLSYWTAEDGARLQEDIAEVFDSPGGKDRYWDEVPLQERKDRYRVHVRPVKREEVVEIDTYRELCELDPSYEGLDG